ncbi:MAG: YraN family protein [Candidatus Binatia bacterium]
MNRAERGRAAEELAADYFRGAGYAVLARNFRSPYGELDLVLERREIVVFVEVRSKGGTRFGTGLESVGPRKQRRLARLAASFLARHRLENRRARFDVVGVEWQDGRPRIDHVENAFEVRENS